VKLSELSCYAAGEIDNCILDRGKNYDAVDELVLRMEKLSRQNMEEMDPSEALIYWEVFREKGCEMEQVNDLKSKVFLEVESLKNIFEVGKKEKERLRGFCIDVSRWALAYECDYEKLFLAA